MRDVFRWMAAAKVSGLLLLYVYDGGAGAWGTDREGRIVCLV